MIFLGCYQIYFFSFRVVPTSRKWESVRLDLFIFGFIFYYFICVLKDQNVVMFCHVLPYLEYDWKSTTDLSSQLKGHFIATFVANPAIYNRTCPLNKEHSIRLKTNLYIRYSLNIYLQTHTVESYHLFQKDQVIKCYCILLSSTQNTSYAYFGQMMLCLWSRIIYMDIYLCIRNIQEIKLFK